MQIILDQHHLFFNGLIGSPIIHELEKRNIRMLQGFITQFENVKSFYNRYYHQSNKPRLVLCGINPGRKGAGKTGVPFLDFKSLSQLMPEINDDEEELSAQFVLKLIEHFGARAFFEHVYLTNISWFGFEETKNGRTVNLNYYLLQEHEQRFFTRGFIDEINAVNPSCIIPLSKQVEKTLLEMKERGDLIYKVGPRLNHPFYCAIPTNTKKGLQAYIKVINEHIRLVK